MNRKLSDSAGPTEDKAEGYFSTLGQTFGCTLREVQKSFRALALQCHPDKAGTDRALINRFQAAATAYQVLSNESSHAAYMHMYRIRCQLHQRPHEEGQTLAPFYLLQVNKKDHVGFEHARVITLDLIDGHLQNWKKDEPHKKTPLSHITEVKVTSATSFSVAFNGDGERLYRLSTHTPVHCNLYVSVLRAIARGEKMPKDDSNFPPSSIRKGYVEKAGKAGDWARRWLILGTTNVLIFRNSDCEAMVNAIPLDGKTCSVKLGTDGNWVLTAMGRKWQFRNSKITIAKAWVGALDKVLKTPPDEVENWHDQRRSLADRRRRPTGPALIRTEEDLKAKTDAEEQDGLLLEDEELERHVGDRHSLLVLDDEEEVHGGRPAALSTVPPLGSGGPLPEDDSGGGDAAPASGRFVSPRASLHQMVSTFNGLFRKDGAAPASAPSARGKPNAVQLRVGNHPPAPAAISAADSTADGSDAALPAATAESPSAAAEPPLDPALRHDSVAAAFRPDSSHGEAAEAQPPTSDVPPPPPPPPIVTSALPPPSGAEEPEDRVLGLAPLLTQLSGKDKEKKAPHSPSIDADFMARSVAGQLGQGMVRTFL